MQVIALENEPSTGRSGQERCLLNICRGLAARNHAISLLYRRRGNFLEEYQTFCQSLIPVHMYRLEVKNNLASLQSFIADLLKVPMDKTSLVYCNQYHDSFFGMALSRLSGVPLICHLHLPPPPQMGWQWTLGMKAVHHMIAVSHHTKMEWVDRGYPADKISVVHNGIDTARFTPTTDRAALRSQLNLPVHRTLISYVGRLDPCKGLETLLKAFALVCKQNPSVHLAIAGKPLTSRLSYLSTLKKLVDELAISPHITFLGHLDYPEQLYRTSDLTVLPSIWSEPFGLSLIESMACGVPALGSRTGGIQEVLTGEFEEALFTPDNREELATVMNRWLDWRDRDPTLGDRCRQHTLCNFTQEHMIDNIERILLYVLANLNNLIKIEE